MNQKEDSFDWLTIGLLILVVLTITFTAFRIFDFTPNIPKPIKIEGWRKLVDSSSNITDSKAAVQLIEFYSYGCEYCNILHHHLQILKKEYGNKISCTYKPIYHHVFGRDYYDAIAAECAGLQYKFEDYSNLLFKGRSNYKQLALQSGIDNISKFSKCVKEKSSKNLVQINQLVADTLGIKGVPFLIINGEGYQGALSLKSLKTIIKAK